MSLRDDLQELTNSFAARKDDRRKVRDEIKKERDQADFELGKKHGIEDIEQIVANIKQAAMNGIKEFELDVDTSYMTTYTPYANGYYEAVKAYMSDCDVGAYSKTRGEKTVTHSIFLYWR